MALYECPKCGNEAASNSRVTALEVPPNLLCVHGDEAIKMERIADAKIREEAIVDE